MSYCFHGTCANHLQFLEIWTAGDISLRSATLNRPLPGTLNIPINLAGKVWIHVKKTYQHNNRNRITRTWCNMFDPYKNQTENLAASLLHVILATALSSHWEVARHPKSPRDLAKMNANEQISHQIECHDYATPNLSLVFRDLCGL